MAKIMLAVLNAIEAGKITVEGPDSVRLLEDLHRRYAGLVYDKALRMLRDRGEAEDAVQEVFFKAFHLIDADRRPPEEYWLAWLYRIATHVCLHALRTRRRKGVEPVDEVRVADGADTERRVSMRQQLERVLGDLDDRGLEILVAHYVDGMSQGLIAQSLGISRRAVVKRLSALRAKVGQVFEPEGEAA